MENIMLKTLVLFSLIAVALSAGNGDKVSKPAHSLGHKAGVVLSGKLNPKAFKLKSEKLLERIHHETTALEKRKAERAGHCSAEHARLNSVISTKKEELQKLDKEVLEATKHVSASLLSARKIVAATHNVVARMKVAQASLSKLNETLERVQTLFQKETHRLHKFMHRLEVLTLASARRTKLSLLEAEEGDPEPLDAEPEKLRHAIEHVKALLAAFKSRFEATKKELTDKQRRAVTRIKEELRLQRNVLNSTLITVKSLHGQMSIAYTALGHQRHERKALIKKRDTASADKAAAHNELLHLQDVCKHQQSHLVHKIRFRGRVEALVHKAVALHSAKATADLSDLLEELQGIYWYDMGPYSACSERCGTGRQSRPIKCVNFREKQVPDTECSKAGLTEPEQTRLCNEHECPVDCLLSGVSWSPCLPSCGAPGTVKREGTRRVVTEPQGHGRKCDPFDMKREDVCIALACDVSSDYEQLFGSSKPETPAAEEQDD